jgi:hypothetical protein
MRKTARRSLDRNGTSWPFTMRLPGSFGAGDDATDGAVDL